jgi:YHS domain-containing protein/thioredoxin-related protein
MSTVVVLALAFSPLHLGVSDSATSPETEIPGSMDMPTETAGEWLTSFADAKALAMERQLPLLLHFEAVWCGACRTMESTVMHQPEVRQHLGSQVIGVRIDADQYRDLISKYSVSSLPTEVIISPDGEELARYQGGVSLSSYVRRLSQLHSQKTVVAESESDKTQESGNDAATRSCLIVLRGGSMVGLGGFSPVALTRNREWSRGTEEFLVTYEGVDYFLQSAEELVEFTAAPEKFVPRMHGCDLVTLSQQGKVEPGAIEFGSFYKGEVYFFTNVSNRDRFQRNPEWYASMAADRVTDPNSQYPFLRKAAIR